MLTPVIWLGFKDGDDDDKHIASVEYMDAVIRELAN